MKAKLFNLIVGILLILLFCSVQTSFGQLVTNTTTTLTYSTIQAAIDDPLTLNGHTLVVAPGVYAENVLVNKELTILGPKAGVDGNHASRGSGEAILYPPTVWYGDGTYNGGYLMRVTAGNVTIDGLTLNGDNPDLEGSYSTNHGAFDIDFGILCYWNGWYEYPGNPNEYVYNKDDDMAGDNLKIRNNILRNFKVHAILMESDQFSTTAKSGEILHNKIQNIPGHALFVYQNYYADIEYNTFESSIWGITVYLFPINKPNNNTGLIKNNMYNLSEVITNWDGSHVNLIGVQMIFLYNGIIDAWEISGNTINNLTTRSQGSHGIAISHCEGQALSIHDNVISNFENGYLLHSSVNFWTPGSLPAAISGGTVSNCTYGVTVINLSEWVGNNPTDHYKVNGVTILNCTVAGVFVASQNVNYDAGFGFNTPTKVFVDVNNCKINGSSVGILNEGNWGYAYAYNNDLSGNSSFAINNLSTNVIDATCNWYGHWTGPTTTANPGGMGTKVSSNVTFDPWVTNGTDYNLTTPGFQPTPGSCVPIKCGNKNKSYLFCHKGKTVCTGYDDALIHISHGDAFGACPGTSYVNSAEKISDETTVLPFKVSNFPNPFSSNTRIQYQLPADCRVMLKVFDMTGKEVMVLVNSEKKAGLYSVDFNASGLGSGIYYYKLTANSNEKEYVQTGKLVKQ
jgi:hypothetical protein